MDTLSKSITESIEQKQKKMFSILKKPKDTVNAEDLEILQNEIERRLVEIVTQKWEFERDLDAINSTSPDSASNNISNSVHQSTINNETTTGTNKNLITHYFSPSQPTTSLPSGKLRNSLKQSLNEATDITSDGFKGSQFLSNSNNNSNGASGSASGANSNETDSVSSESSLVSNLTGSTIITATSTDLGSQATATATSNKRSLKNSSNDRPSKRFRQDSSNFLRSTGSYSKHPSHSKHRPKIVPSKFRNSIEESRLLKNQILKNEAPDKFWPFVEQFCATPTEEQMKDLEAMIEAIDDDKDYYKVPALGKKNASKDSPTRNDNTSNSKNQRKSRSKTEDESSLGALTQRLVSSFIEETDDIGPDVSKSSSDASSPPAKKRRTKGNKGIDLKNATNLEKKIRQQLEEYSILAQQDDIPFASEEDEILRELLAHQHELLTIQTQNRHYMQHLLKKARKHSELEQEREKLKEANADVIAAYVRLIQAKQRKRNPTKKEKDVAWKALKVHDDVFKKCDDLYIGNLDRNNSV